MSSIAHMLAHNEQSTATNDGSSNTSKNPTSSFDEGSPKITSVLSSTNSNNLNEKSVPRIQDNSSSIVDDSLENSKESSSSSSNFNSNTHPITPAIRPSVDLSNDTNSGKIDSSDLQIKHQRKRSKVSRACDECRRKKIRCDATFSTTSNSVLKPCTSCIKNKESCSFDRVPLKRGPTKGYTKDGDSKEGSRSSASRRSSSMGNQPIHSQNEHHQQQQGPKQSSSSPITLPPLVSLTNNVAFRNYSNAGKTSPSNNSNHQLEPDNGSQPTSPRRGSAFGQGGNDSANFQGNPSQQINNPNGSVPQGLFWKVPYSQGPFDRRGSVDSVSSSLSDTRSPRFSSTSTTGGGNFIFGQRAVNYESSVISDSDDDRGSNYSPRASIDITRSNRSRSNSANLQVPTSPALSISSLNSLNQGFNKNMNIQTSNHNIGLIQQQQSQLVELYYQYIHPSFPILPLNKQSLGNLLTIPPPTSDNNNNAEIHEVNNLIVHSFYSSLDALVNAASRGSRSPSIISLPNGAVNYNTVDIINQIFGNLLKIFPVLQSKFSLYSQNIVILLAASLVSAGYAVTLLGYESDVYISSCVSIFNKLKIFRLFWDTNHLVTKENYDDYNSILKRLSIDLDIIDSLQSLSFGVPKILSIDYEFSLIDNLFPNITTFNTGGGSSVGVDFELTKNSMKFGLILSKIGSARNFANPTSSTFLSQDLKNKYNYFSNVLNKSSNQDHIPSFFLDLVIAKFEFIGFLDEIAQSFPNENSIDEELVYDFQLKALRVVKKHLELQSTLLRSVKNYSNSIENNFLISPFLPLAFKQSIKALNIQKIVINSLQINKDLITRLSKPLNDLISLNNYLSLLKPFKNDDMNNHMKFQFTSSHLKFLDYYIENTSSNNQTREMERFQHWLGLMKDLRNFVRNDDFDGWF